MKYTPLFMLAALLWLTPVSADYLSDQKQMNTDIAAELKQTDYTPENPLILVNPYGISPLTALISFSTPTPSSVGITIQGKDAETTISHTFSTISEKHIIPVYGLYEGKNTVLLQVRE